MTLRRWLGGWVLLIGALAAWGFAFSYAPGDAWWLVMARWLVGFAGLPLLVWSVMTFFDRPDPAQS